ncbi:MAG TPA: hypothetical protein VIY50_13210 [Steroidobacteraceae bacterium]
MAATHYVSPEAGVAHGERESQWAFARSILPLSKPERTTESLRKDKDVITRRQP